MTATTDDSLVWDQQPHGQDRTRHQALSVESGCDERV